MTPKLHEMKPTEAARRSALRTRQKEVERRTNPRTEADFELLYNELEQWRQKELAVIAQSGGTKEQRTDILNQQTRALATIDRLRATAVKRGRGEENKAGHESDGPA